MLVSFEMNLLKPLSSHSHLHMILRDNLLARFDDYTTWSNLTLNQHPLEMSRLKPQFLANH